jgi:hypothetical protein
MIRHTAVHLCTQRQSYSPNTLTLHQAQYACQCCGATSHGYYPEAGCRNTVKPSTVYRTVHMPSHSCGSSTHVICAATSPECSSTPLDGRCSRHTHEPRLTHVGTTIGTKIDTLQPGGCNQAPSNHHVAKVDNTRCWEDCSSTRRARVTGARLRAQQQPTPLTHAVHNNRSSTCATSSCAGHGMQGLDVCMRRSPSQGQHAASAAHRAMRE